MYSVEKITLCSLPPQPPAVGGGGSGERGIIMPLGEEWRGLGSFWGQVVRKYLERDLQTFTGSVTFRFSFRFWLIFAFIFFAVWSVSLDCEQSKKKPFFSLQSENKNPHIFACFRFKRIWVAHPRGGAKACIFSVRGQPVTLRPIKCMLNVFAICSCVSYSHS